MSGSKCEMGMVAILGAKWPAGLDPKITVAQILMLSERVRIKLALVILFAGLPTARIVYPVAENIQSA